MIQGGMGIAAGGNINPDGVSMFEPIGGTAPDHVGKGTINPLAAIGAVQMLLAQLGEERRGARVYGGHPVRVHEDGVDARRGDGLLHLRRRRPRRGAGDRMSAAAVPPEGRAVRHDAPRRRAADRPVVLHRGSHADPPQDRSARGAVHRGRLAGREPPRHRVLQARDEGDAPARGAHVVRHDAEGGRARGGQRRPPGAAGDRDGGRLHRRQGVGRARHRGAPDRPGRRRGDGARLGRVPARAGPPGLLRRGALLRRLSRATRRTRWTC